MSATTPLSRETIITGFDGFQSAMDGMSEAFAQERNHVYVLADHPEDHHLANHADQGWIRFSDFLYPSEAFNDPENAHTDLKERADTTLFGTLFAPLDHVDPHAHASRGRVYVPGEFSTHVTGLSNEHPDSIIISGRFHPPGDYELSAPHSDHADAYAIGELSIPATVIPGEDIRGLMACNPTLFGSLIIPRDLMTEDALEVADRGLDVKVETDGGDA